MFNFAFVKQKMFHFLKVQFKIQKLTFIPGDAALVSAASCAGGSIRKLNSIVTNALTIASQKEMMTIDPEIVQSAADELALCN